jgi:hypothetical protein
MTERLDPLRVAETEDRADAQSTIEIALKVRSAVRKALSLNA